MDLPGREVGFAESEPAFHVTEIGSVVAHAKGIPTSIPGGPGAGENPPNMFGKPVKLVGIGLTVVAVEGLPYPYTIAACP